MAEFKTIGKLLKLKGMKVTGVSFHRDQVARIAVTPFKNGLTAMRPARPDRQTTPPDAPVA